MWPREVAMEAGDRVPDALTCSVFPPSVLGPAPLPLFGDLCPLSFSQVRNGGFVLDFAPAPSSSDRQGLFWVGERRGERGGGGQEGGR